MGRVQEFVAELKRRRVIRALLVWGVVAFGVLQVYEPVMHGLHLPEWTLSFVVIGLGLGFPVTVALSWAFDLTTGGVERTPAGAGPGLRGPRVALLLAGLGLLAAAPGLGWFLLHRGAPQVSDEPATRPAASVPSIAVLPFADMSPQHDQEYFSDGVAEEILNALAAVEGLHVAGRTSSFSFKGKNATLEDIARQLHVGYVLEGSLRREGPHVRITAQLVDARDGYHVWSQTFDRELAGIFALQDEISRAVVSVLKVKLLPASRPSASDGRAASPEAYADYLIGRQLLNRGMPESTLEAIPRYENAVALDPGFAAAWSGLASALFLYADSADNPSGEVERLEARALAAADRAVAVGNGVAEAWSVRGYLHMRINWDWASAATDLKSALTLAPGDAATLLRQGALQAALGRAPEAIASMRRALELDPLDAFGWATLSDASAFAGQDEEARRAAERALEIAPGSLLATRDLIFLDLKEGRPGEALARAERSTVTWSRLSGTALAQHALGHPKEAQEALDALIAGYAQIASLQVAEVYAWRGDPDRAFEWLERAFRQRDSGLARIKHRPGLAPLRGDPRFAKVLRKMHLPVD